VKLWVRTRWLQVVLILPVGGSVNSVSLLSAISIFIRKCFFREALEPRMLRLVRKYAIRNLSYPYSKSLPLLLNFLSAFYIFPSFLFCTCLLPVFFSLCNSSFSPFITLVISWIFQVPYYRSSKSLHLNRVVQESRFRPEVIVYMYELKLEDKTGPWEILNARLLWQQPPV
jgi:hypothetical protein